MVLARSRKYDPVKGMREGSMYRVVYKAQKGNGQWWKMEFTAKFIGTDSRDNPIGLFFSFRPETGTSSLSASQVIEAWPMPWTTKPSQPVNVERIEAP